MLAEIPWGQLLSSGAAGIVGGAIVVLGARIVGDRIQGNRVAHHAQELESLKNEYSRQLENLKASRARDLEEFRATATQQKEAIAMAIGALTHGYTASHAKVLDAYDDLWRVALRIRQVTAQYLAPYLFLVPSEYTQPPLRPVIENMIPKHDQMAMLMPEIEPIEQKRHLMGEDLWRLFVVYRAFAGRLTFKIMQGKEAGWLPEWHQNLDRTPDLQLLRIVFDETEINDFLLERMGAPQRILDTLEVRMLHRMNEWLLGRELLGESIERQEKLATRLREATKPPVPIGVFP